MPSEWRRRTMAVAPYLNHCCFGDMGLKTAVPPAFTEATAGNADDMAELACQSMTAVIDFAIDDQRGPDPGSHGNGGEIFVVAARTEPPLGQGEGADLGQ